MTAGRATLAAAALAVLAVAAAAAAQPYDPDFRWRTLETARFRIHYHQGEEELAQEVAGVAERAHARLAPLLGWDPRRTEVVISDDVDEANGSATPLPYATIRLFAVPPTSLSELNDYRDWVEALFTHEYVHILHLDHVGGIPAAFNAVFGKLAFPNGLVPSWMIEGLAVAHESGGDPRTGRNASAIHAMYARALAVEGPEFPRLDEASNQYLGWPSGDVPYLLGGRFMAWLEARYGMEAMRGYIARQGSQIWPYAPSWVGARFFGGETFPTLWREYADHERGLAAEVLAGVRARPVTAPVRLTTAGGRAERPRWSPDGTYVLYWRSDLDRRPGLFRVGAGGEGERRVANVEQNGTFALRTPREALVASGEVFHEYRVYDDLYRVDVETGRTERLTRGERATDPDVLPGGSTIVYVRRTSGGGLALVERDLDARGGLGPRRELFARDGAQVYMPRLSPDGRRIAFELHEGGRRDVVVLEDGALRRVTDDDALDLGPAWSPDGRYLLFASDRTGVFDLYAWDRESGAIRQVTNIESGALAPDVSPDGKAIAFLHYSRAGYDVATIPFDPASWLEAATPTATSTATSEPTPPENPTPSPRPTSPPLPSRPYRALDTLGPTYWLPVLSYDAAGLVAGALTGGTDVLGRHAWTAQGWWSARAQEPGYAISYAGAWSWPQLDLSSSRIVSSSPDPAGRLLDAWNYADAGATFTFTRLARQLALRIGWSGTRYDTLRPGAPIPAPPYDFRDGFLSDLSLRASYGDERRFVRSISPEEGRTASVTLRFASRETGSDYDLARVRASVAQYLRLPATKHGVLALRLAGGVAHGTLGGAAPYELGGVAQADVVAIALGTVGEAPDALRGYAVGALEGTGFVLGNVEARFPLGAPALGRSTWPLFLRRIHGALFFDAGDAFDMPGQLAIAGHGLSARELRAGVGAELRLELVFGYWVRTDLRIGLARALGAVFGAGRAADARPSEPALAPVNAYVVLGPSF